MTSVTDWLLQNRDRIETGVEILGKASEVLAATVGQLHPILEAIFVASAELLSNPDGKDAQYLTEQFGQVNQKLEGIQDEMCKIALVLERASMNQQNFDQEGHMLSQYDKFQDFINARPEMKEKKKNKFLIQYDNTGRDGNLDALYNAVIGESMGGLVDPMLETVVRTEQRSRRAVEDFCASLKKLFVVGLIAVMGHAALKKGVVGDDIVKKWQERMQDVESRMKAAVDDCTDNFAVQAKLDMEHQLQQTPGKVDLDFTQSLLDSLVQKYDWVNWSIRVFKDTERFFFFNWMAGEPYHGSGGGDNYFDVLKNNFKVVISFSVKPAPINRSQIQEQIETQKLKGNMKDVALSLSNSIPNCLVHAVSAYKKMPVETNNFPEDCYYYGKHKRAYLYIHPK